MRAAVRRLVVRLIATLPPPAARRVAALAGFLMRDVGRTRASVTTMSRALALVLDAGDGADDRREDAVPRTLEEIAARSGRRLEELADWARGGLLGPPAEPGPPPRWVGGLERTRLVAYLLRRGIGLEALTAAAAEDRLPLLVVEQAIAGRGTMTAEQVAAAAGVELDLAERILAALGIPRGERGDRLFGRREVRALRIMCAMRPVFTDAQLLDMSAVIGRAMATIAAAEVESFRNGAGRRLSAGHDFEVALRTSAVIDLLVGPTGILLDTAHRRHLEAAISAESAIRLEEATGSLPGQEAGTVGFADLVGYTAVSEHLSPLALGELSSRLLRTAEGTLPDHGVRIVKTIGDAVMFSARDAAAGAAAAVALVERVRVMEGMPPLHVGIATGPVLRRHADYFGRTVNVAARLCEAAPAHGVLVYGLTAADTAALQAVALSVGAHRSLHPRGLAAPVDVAEVRRTAG